MGSFRKRRQNSVTALPERRARSPSRNYHSMRRFDRDITHRRAPLLFLVMLARNRRVGAAHARRVSVGAGAGTDRRIAKTITAASRLRSLALRQGVKAAAQSAVFRDVATAILVWARRGRCGTAKKCRASDRRSAKSQKLFHVLSPDLLAASRGRVKLGHSVPLSNLSKDAKSGSPETTST
jgi:hypothetical protein